MKGPVIYSRWEIILDQFKIGIKNKQTNKKTLNLGNVPDITGDISKVLLWISLGARNILKLKYKSAILLSFGL